jgi:NADH dehydrogenase FAD-containing subunit
MVRVADVTPHVLIAGGGYVGMYTAFRLRRAVRKGDVSVTVVDPRPVMTYSRSFPRPPPAVSNRGMSSFRSVRSCVGAA